MAAQASLVLTAASMITATTAVSLRKMQAELASATQSLAAADRRLETAMTLVGQLPDLDAVLADIETAKAILADAEKTAAPVIAAHAEVNESSTAFEAAKARLVAAKSALKEYEDKANAQVAAGNKAQEVEDAVEKARIANAVRPAAPRRSSKPATVKPVEVKDATGCKIKNGDTVRAVRSVRVSGGPGDGTMIEAGDGVKVCWTPDTSKDKRCWGSVGISIGNGLLGFVNGDDFRIA